MFRTPAAKRTVQHGGWLRQPGHPDVVARYHRPGGSAKEVAARGQDAAVRDVGGPAEGIVERVPTVSPRPATGVPYAPSCVGGEVVLTTGHTQDIELAGAPPGRRSGSAAAELTASPQRMETSPVYEAHFTRTPFQLLAGRGWEKLVAFRVDSGGVLLGGAPARYDRQLPFVPWADITGMVLWQQQTAGNNINHIGVQRRDGTPHLPGMNSHLSREQTSRLAPHIDHELFLASRPVNFWRLEPERLQTAVDTYAPHVPVLVYAQPHLS